MRRLAISAILLSSLATATVVRAADKVRFAYTVQVHQAHMMVLPDYAKKYNIEIEPVPMRRYADQQLALMTNQVDVAVMGYINVGLMEEKSFRDYRAIAGVFTGGQSLTLGQGHQSNAMEGPGRPQAGNGPEQLCRAFIQGERDPGRRRRRENSNRQLCGRGTAAVIGAEGASDRRVCLLGAEQRRRRHCRRRLLQLA